MCAASTYDELRAVIGLITGAAFTCVPVVVAVKHGREKRCRCLNVSLNREDLPRIVFAPPYADPCHCTRLAVSLTRAVCVDNPRLALCGLPKRF